MCSFKSMVILLSRDEIILRSSGSCRQCVSVLTGGYWHRAQAGRGHSRSRQVCAGQGCCIRLLLPLCCPCCCPPPAGAGGTCLPLGFWHMACLFIFLPLTALQVCQISLEQLSKLPSVSGLFWDKTWSGFWQSQFCVHRVWIKLCSLHVYLTFGTPSLLPICADRVL